MISDREVGAAELAIVQYWHDSEPPAAIRESMASFDRHSPQLPHLVFDRSSAAEFIACRFSDRELRAFESCAQPTCQADYLRYCAGYALGGLCVDADIRCLTDVGPLIETPARGLVCGQRDRPAHRVPGLPLWPRRVGPLFSLVNGAFAFGSPREPLLGLAIELATAGLERPVADGAVGIWLTTGPGVLTALYLLYQLGSLEEYARYAKGTLLEQSIDLVCETVGESARVERAFDGVEMADFDHWGRFLEHADDPEHTRSRAHWSRLRDGAFR